MREKVMTLGDAVQVLPGHGPETTIGRERSDQPVSIRVASDFAPSAPSVSQMPDVIFELHLGANRRWSAGATAPC